MIRISWCWVHNYKPDYIPLNIQVLIHEEWPHKIHIPHSVCHSFLNPTLELLNYLKSLRVFGVLRWIKPSSVLGIVEYCKVLPGLSFWMPNYNFPHGIWTPKAIDIWNVAKTKNKYTYLHIYLYIERERSEAESSLRNDLPFLPQHLILFFSPLKKYILFRQRILIINIALGLGS